MMKRKITILTLLLALSPGLIYGQSTQQVAPSVEAQEFRLFWSEFRVAISANNKNKIVSLTKFPFKTRGRDDSDSVRSYNKASFLKLWNRLLALDPGLSAQPDTMRRLIGRKTEIASEDMRARVGSVYVGGFVFEKVNGRWLFTMAYLDD